MNNQWKGMGIFSYGAALAFAGVSLVFLRDALTNDTLKFIIAIMGGILFLSGLLLCLFGMIKHWIATIRRF